MKNCKYCGNPLEDHELCDCPEAKDERGEDIGELNYKEETNQSNPIYKPSHSIDEPEETASFNSSFNKDNNESDDK